MANIKVGRRTYRGVDKVSFKDADKTGETVEFGHNVEYVPGPSTLINKTITENGVYLASDEGADGFNSITVDIPTTAGVSEVEKDVNFYDYDGTIVHSYTDEEFLELSSLPENPFHANLITQGWNLTLGDAQEYVRKYGRLSIGQTYTTKSGKNEYDIRVNNELGKDITLGLEGVEKDWGDGTIDTLESHTYLVNGDYTIKFGGDVLPELEKEIRLKAIRIANGVNRIEQYSFESCFSLKYVTFPKSISFIGTQAFSYCTNLICVILPASEIELEQEIFSYCASLKHIIFSNLITTISSYMFCECTSLTSVEILSNTYTIGSRVFENCYNLKEVIIPYGVNIIENGAFGNCHNLTSIIIPNSVNAIKSNAFYNCYSLLLVEIPSNVANFSDYAFYNCWNLRQVKGEINTVGKIVRNCSSSSVEAIITSGTKIESEAFYNAYGLKSINIPAMVTEIGERAFRGCEKLLSIELPTKLNKIGKNAFTNCTGLTSIIVPNSVNYIGEAAFSGCSSLESITIPFIGEKPNPSDNGYPFGWIFGSTQFANSTQTTQTNGNRSFNYYIPDSLNRVEVTSQYWLNSTTLAVIEELPIGAFMNCNNLTSIRIPSRIRTIKQHTFEGCVELRSFDMPQMIDRIEDYAFKNCKKLNFNDIDCDFIGENAFQGCSSLQRLNIDVTTIKNQAFAGCSELTRVYLSDKVIEIGEGAFIKCGKLTEIDISSNNLYFKSDNNVIFSKDMTELVLYPYAILGDYEIPNGVKYILNYAFYNYQGEQITMPSGLKTIGDFAFFNSRIKALRVPGTLSHIGCYAFIYSDITELTAYYATGMSRALLTIKEQAFANTSIQKVTFSDIKEIEYHAFADCFELNSFYFGQYLQTIGDGAFYSCNNLNVNLDRCTTLRTIGTYAFYACRVATNINIPSGVTTIGEGAFSACSGLNSITVPFVGEEEDSDKNNYFGYIFGDKKDNNGISGGFWQGNNYRSYYIPSNLESVTILHGGTPDYAFYKCSGIKNIKLAGDTTSITGNAFYNCGKLKTLIVPIETPPTITSSTLVSSITSIQVPNTAVNTYKNANYWKNKKSIITAIPEGEV